MLAGRLADELGGKDPASIQTLNLDHTPSTGNLENSGLTDAFVALRKLSLNGVGLTVIRHLPLLPKLRKLELGDNRLSNGLERLATACPQLVHLNLVNNRFKDPTALEPLKALKSLRTLNVEQNPLASNDSYRKALFAMLPNLQYIDDENEAGEAREDEESSDEDEEEDEEEEGEEGEAEGEAEGEVEGEGEGENEGEAEGDDDGEEEGDEGPGLAYLQRDLDDEEEDDEGDFQPGAEGEEAEDDDIEDEDDEEPEEEQTSKRSRTH